MHVVRCGRLQQTGDVVIVVAVLPHLLADTLQEWWFVGFVRIDALLLHSHGHQVPAGSLLFNCYLSGCRYEQQ